MSTLRKVDSNVQPRPATSSSTPAPGIEKQVIRPQVTQRNSELLQQVLSAFSAIGQKSAPTAETRPGNLPSPLEKLSHLVPDANARAATEDQFDSSAETMSRSVNVDGKTVNLPSPSERLQALREAIDDGNGDVGELLDEAGFESPESEGSSDFEPDISSSSFMLDEALEEIHEESGNLRALNQMAEAEQLGDSLHSLLDQSAHGELMSELSSAETPASASDGEQLGPEQHGSEQLFSEFPQAARRFLAGATAAHAEASEEAKHADLHGSQSANYAEGSKSADQSTRSEGTRSASTRFLTVATSAANNPLPTSAAAYLAGQASRSSAMPASSTASKSRTTAATTPSKAKGARVASGIASKSSAAIADEVDLDAITSLDLSPTESSLYNKLKEEDPEAAERFKLQQKLAKIAELAAMLSNIAKMRHDAAMAIIANMRG
ncbi:MAG: hypothetical protein ACT4TC_23685 [Myxococcaceae bacterium]